MRFDLTCLWLGMILLTEQGSKEPPKELQSSGFSSVFALAAFCQTAASFYGSSGLSE